MGGETQRAARASLRKCCQLRSLLSHSGEGSPHTPYPQTTEPRLGTLLWSPRPALVRVQSACMQHCSTFSCLPDWHLQLHKRPLFSLFPVPRAWFNPGPKGQRPVPVPFSKLSCFPLLNLLTRGVEL